MRKLPVRMPNHWDTPDGHQMASDYLDKPRSWLAMGEHSDLAIANAVYLASRNDFELIDYQTAAKERIRWLSAQLAGLINLLESVPLPSTMGTAEAHYRLFYDWLNNVAEPAIARAKGGEA